MMELSSPVPGLPFEIVLAIIDAVYDVPSLGSLSRTCRDIHNVANPLLYRRGFARDDVEVQSTINIHTNYDTEERIRNYSHEPYAKPIVLWAAEADPVYGLPVLERVLAQRPLHLWATFHLPGDTCQPHWPWTCEPEEPLSSGRITALHVAAVSGNFPVVYWLLEDHLSRSNLGLEVTATFACVCPSRHLQVLRQKHGLIDAEDCPDATPLHLALAHGHLDVAKLLILCGANWSQFTEGCHGVTGLMMIAANGHLPLMQWLLSSGMLTRKDVLYEDNMGFKAKDYLAACDKEKARKTMACILTDRKLDQPCECGSMSNTTCGMEDSHSCGSDELSIDQEAGIIGAVLE